MSNITGNMGLTIWDTIKDDFDYGQLEDNWIAVDQHDHTPERGVRLSTASIQADAITQELLAPNSVGAAQLQAGAVSGNSIAEGTITGDKVAPYTITPGLIESLSLTFQQMDPAVVPMGSIMLWWRPPGSGATPGGVWEIMDGRAWNSITNYWNLETGNIPDMINAFAMGTGTTSGVGVGNTGGSSEVNLAHAHNVLAHTHGVPAHAHTISLDGNHWHTFMNGGNLATRQNTVPTATTALEGWPGGGSVPVNSYSAYFPPGSSALIAEYEGFSNDFAVAMDEDGLHSHGGFTGNSGDFPSDAAAPETDTQLGASDLLPPYVGLCYIMKCREW